MTPFGTAPRKSGRGVVALVLGILSWVGGGFITGIAAWIIGNNVLRDMDRGIEDPTDRGIAQGGRILGMLATIGSALALCFVGGIFMLTVIGARSTMPALEKEYSRASIAHDDAAERRSAILQAAKTTREHSPELDYGELARELSSGHVKWYTEVLQPPSGCGSYRFSGGNGKLTVVDDCGSSSLEGWPPTESMNATSRD